MHLRFDICDLRLGRAVGSSRNKGSAMGGRPSAFTLVEMLVVITIIVLALSLAIPAIQSLTGSRSEEAAQNTISAILARARAEAIGLQRVEGVMFYLDPATGRVNCAEVMGTTYEGPNYETPGITYLDLVPDRDTLALPTGIQLTTMKDQANATTEGQDQFPNVRYLGFNSYGASQTPPFGMIGGVMLFDGNGRVMAGRYGFRFCDHTQVPAQLTPMAQLLYGNATTAAQATNNANWPGPNHTNNQILHAQVAFSLFNAEEFNTAVSGGGTNAAADQWLDGNATPVFVNRYTGTLTRAE